MSVTLTIFLCVMGGTKLCVVDLTKDVTICVHGWKSTMLDDLLGKNEKALDCDELTEVKRVPKSVLSKCETCIRKAKECGNNRKYDEPKTCPSISEACREVCK